MAASEHPPAPAPAPATQMAPPPAAAAPPAADGPTGQPQTEFAKGDVAYAFHKGLLYQCKVLAVSVAGDRVRYFIHYQKWSQRWDEWVDPSRIRRDTAETRAEADRLLAEHKAALSARASVGGSKRPGSAPAAAVATAPAASGKRGKKRAAPEPAALPDSVEADQELAGRKEIRLTLPGVLKDKLISDWENIQKHQLVSLPRDPTVSQILQNYQASKPRKPPHEKIAKQVVDGLRTFFNHALPTILLYRFERPQYEDQVRRSEGKVEMADIYGAEHLLRLLLKLPSLLAHTQMDEAQVSSLQKQLADFIKWLQKNDNFFLREYVGVDRDYILRVSVSTA